MRKTRILFVDDDKNYVEKLANVLKGQYEVIVANSVEEFWNKYVLCAYDLLIIDIRLNEYGKGDEGLHILEEVKKLEPNQEAIVLTMYEESEFMIDALTKGATMFLSKKDFTPRTILKMVNMAVEKSRLKKKVSALKREIETLKPYEIIGNSPIMKKVKENIKRAALDGEITVLIRGESGTGKELVARNIHHLGVRKDGPFVAVAVSGLNRETIYSELFGHEKGSFTGALQRKKGFFEEANGGILFLDEIGDLEQDLQVKLLRVIEERSFTRLGGTREVSIDVQFIAATNRNLSEMVLEEKFREDLYYRLKAFEIFIPPLRERKEDIELIAIHFLKNLYSKGRTTAKKISERVLVEFYEYDWPGNIRELRNVVEYAGIQARGSGDDVIKISHLPEGFRKVYVSEKSLDKSRDYKYFLAKAELELIDDAIKNRRLRKKTELARYLQYPNRFTFVRRVKRIFENYRELRKVFPEVSNLFPEE